VAVAFAGQALGAFAKNLLPFLCERLNSWSRTAIKGQEILHGLCTDTDYMHAVKVSPARYIAVHESSAAHASRK
jgi:hypothetical protein